jgi:2-oxoglutarate ferredoxin oxidoreductase subunit delta
LAGKVVFDQERCKGCEICVFVCPRKLLSLGEARNQAGYRTATITDAERCTGCAICAQMCPDCVIQVYREPARSAAGLAEDHPEGKLGR